MVPLRKVSVLWDKKYSTENRDNPFYAWKISIAQFFWNTEALLYKDLWYSETKHFGRKIVILPAPPSYPYSLAIPESFWNAEGFVYKKIGFVRQKNLRKNRHTPLFVRKTFRCRKISEIKEGNFPGDKKISTTFSDNSLYVSTTLSHPVNRQSRKTSETPKTSWNTKTAPYQYFGTGIMRDKSFSNFSVDTGLCFTEIFALEGWVASTFSQLVVFLHIC